MMISPLAFLMVPQFLNLPEKASSNILEQFVRHVFVALDSRKLYFSSYSFGFRNTFGILRLCLWYQQWLMAMFYRYIVCFANSCRCRDIQY
jgi:hypothetical protein